MILHRYTAESFLEAARHAAPGTWSHAWCGGLGRPATLERATYGDDANVPQARALLERVQGAVETPRTTWRRDVAGAYPVVAEYLQGLPDCMRARRRSLDLSNPIAVYASIMAPAIEDADNMMRRGIAILALALKLQAQRPIDLYAVCPWVATTLVIRIPTRPLSIAHAAFALSHPAYFRRLAHEVLYATGDQDTSINNDSYVPKILGMKPTDIYIGTGMSTLDWSGTRANYLDMQADPIAWINAQLKRIAGGGR